MQRLRKREIGNSKQQFVYTPQLLRALTKEADIVIPISRFATNDRNQIHPVVHGYLERNGLKKTIKFHNVRLCNISGYDALFFKPYLLIYGYQGDMKKIEFNLIHKITFTFDMMLQAGTPCI